MFRVRVTSKAYNISIWWINIMREKKSNVENVAIILRREARLCNKELE